MGQTLDQFFSSRDWASIEAVSRWTVQRDDLNRDLVRLQVLAADGERYTVLFACDGYPVLAPSVAFISALGSKADPTAWPKGAPAFFEEVKPPPSSFLCMPLTREGLAQHADWRNSPANDVWDGERHSLLDLFNRVQRLLNGPHYSGRGGG